MTQTGRPSSITTAWTARFSSSEAGPVPEVEEAEEGGVRSGEHGGRAGVGQPLQPVGVAQPAARRLVAEAGLRAGGGVPDGVITGGAVLSSRVRCVGRKKKFIVALADVAVPPAAPASGRLVGFGGGALLLSNFYDLK
jgi:hypothetical protein